MNIFKELSQAAVDTEKLQPRYYWLTSMVGVIGVAIGMAALWISAVALANAMAIDPDGAVQKQWTEPLWLAFVLVGIPVFFYCGCVIAAGCVALLMIGGRKMTNGEALRYTFLSRYPIHWFKASPDA